MADKSPVKINKNHKGKEFKGRFHFVGKVKPVKKKEEGTENWVEQPFYVEKPTKTNKPRRSLQFVLETAKANDLKIEVAGMEQKFAYPFSMKSKQSFTIAWADRLDKTKYPDSSYHIINGTDWDRAEDISTKIAKDQWVEVKGSYEISSFNDDDGDEKTSIKRIVEEYNIIEDGAEITLDKKTKVKYVCDFDSSDFIEVNKYNMQIGIRNTYQKDEKQDTQVRAVFLTNGKERSEPKDIELIVYYKEAMEGDKPLADAFATLNRLDFIEVNGQDNNRATYTYVDVVDNLEDDDPFNEVSPAEKTTKQERVVNGVKKGLEITGYTTLIRGFLSEQEILKSADVKTDDPFLNQTSDNDSSDIDEEDPFAE
jgi:hypothetical protein